MRYWLLTTEFPPFYGGGISTYCDVTAAMLYNKGHDVTVFLPDFSVSGIKETYQNGVRVIRFIPRQTNAHEFLGYTAYLSYEFAEVVKQYLLEESPPDIIEAHEYQAIAYYIQQFKWLRIAPFTNLKIVITCHSPSFICLDYNQVPVYQFPDYWTGEMEKACIKSADLVLFPSQYLVTEIEKRFSLAGVNYQIVPNPFQDDRFSPATGTAVEEDMVVCFGKLAPLKGTFELLSYFDTLWAGGSPLKLYIVGSTGYFFYPEGKTMYDLVHRKYKKHLDEKRLVLTGNLSPEACSAYLQKARIVIVPSLFDNFPYTVLEAMAMGKTVLASKQGGQTEMIQHGQNGFLFDHHKKDDFFEQLHALLEVKHEDLKKIETQAQQRILHSYQPAVIYDQKINWLDQLLQDNSPKNEYPFITNCTVPNVDANAPEAAMHGLLSIVIPFYNMGAYVEATVQSVFASDYKNIEVIVIDDGSTDAESIAVLSSLQKKFPVQVHTTQNNGLAATRNYGALLASGHYLAFLDSDDMVEPSYYSKAVAVLQHYTNVHFVGSWLAYCGDGRGTWPTFNPEPPYLLVHNSINSSAVVLKRHTFVTCGGNCTNLTYGMEDWESVINMVSKGYRGVVIPQKLFNYRVRKGSMSQSFTREKQLYLQKIIVQKHRHFYSQYSAEIVQLLNSNGASLYFDNPTFEVARYTPSKALASLKTKLKEYIKRNKLLRKAAYTIYKTVKAK